MPSPCTTGRGSVRARRTIAAAAVIAGLVIPSTVVASGKSETVDRWKLEQTENTTSKIVQPAPPLPLGAVVQGSLPSTTRLSVTLALNPTDPSDLDTLAAGVTDPSSPLYGQYVTPEEFAARFGAPPSAVSSVQDWARANGLTITCVSANRLSVVISGTVSTMDRAFGTTLDKIRLADGEPAYANVTNASLPSSISGSVEAVIGLDSLLNLSPSISVGTTTTRAAAGTKQLCRPFPTAPSKTSPKDYTPAQFESAYNFAGLTNDDATGYGERIALAEVGGYIPGDIACYQAHFNTHASVDFVPIPEGEAGAAPSAETTLDIEVIAGIAPDATIDVYEEASTGSLMSDQEALYIDYEHIIAPPNNRNPLDDIVDISHGGCELYAQDDLGAKVWMAEDRLFEEAVTNHQEVFAGSGDDGSEGCYPNTKDKASTTATALAVDDPASQPYVTAVGGTSLSSATWPPKETVWNTPQNSAYSGASGGGISGEWAMPSWQHGPGVISNQIESTPCPDPSAKGFCREVPDVSAAAGGASLYYQYFRGAWTSNGGTSAAAPLWAALDARLDEYCGKNLGFLNPSLYQIAATGEPGFNDVTRGNNDYLKEPGFYIATRGYDMATGLGSPDATALAHTLCGAGVPIISTDGTLSLPDATVGQPYTTELTTADHRDGTWAVNARSLPSGLSLSGYTISGTPTTAGSVSFGLMFTDTDNFTATVLATIVVSGASGGGSSWTAAEAPLPPGAAHDSFFGPLACPSVGSCVATGFYVDSSGAQRGLIDTLSGGTWTAREAPVPQGAGSDPEFVSGPLVCPSVGSCVTVGLYGGDSAGKAGVIDTLSGGTWKATEAPLPRGAADSPMTRWYGLACPSVDSCVATGSNGAGQGLIDTLSGGTWTAAEAPLPLGVASYPEVQFGPVACPSVGSCVATGSYDDSNGRDQGLIEMLSGGTWKATEVPVPQGALLSPVVLDALACPSVGSCVATGSYVVGSNDDVQGLIDTLSGGTWTETEAPVPPGAGSDPIPDLDAVACPSVGSCVATGSYSEPNNDYQSLIETLSGGTWTAAEVPLPRGAKETYDSGVYGLACPSVDSCAVTGGYDDSSFDGEGLIEMLSGGTWTAAEAPLPQRAARDPKVYLESVACPSVGSCVATGGYVDSNGRGQGLIEDMG